MRFSQRFNISNYIKEEISEDSIKSKREFDKYSLMNRDRRDYSVIKDPTIHYIFLKRYFAKIRSFSPVVAINNKGVEYALKGRFKEAEILFKEAIKEDVDFAPAYNNLGIIFEFFCYTEDAFTMYSKACIIDPGNHYYRRNFLYFRDYDVIE